MQRENIKISFITKDNKKNIIINEKDKKYEIIKSGIINIKALYTIER